MIAFLFALVILGTLFYLVETYIPLAPPFRVAFRVCVVLTLIWWALALIGLAPRAPLAGL